MSSSALAAGLRQLRGKMALQVRNEESDEQLLAAFLHHRDESAFATLVRRHGPMVLHVCRRVLGHEQDAEDAFQSTFLVLARKAGSLRNQTSLAGFLHGIAYREALKARQSAARRRKHEGRAAPRSPVDPCEDLLWREVRMLLDEEIARLPEIYRSAFVLCCLQGISGAEAARRLAVKEGTLSSRLRTARKRLQRRLARRGVELTAVLAAVAVATPSAPALPMALIASTTEAALAMPLGQFVISPSIAELMQRAAPILAPTKVKIAVAVLLALGVLAGFGGWRTTGESRQSEPAPAGSLRTLAPPEKRDAGTVKGRVLDPDGKPVRGAKLLFVWWSEDLPKKVWATSDTEGRFSFSIARTAAANSAWEMSREKPFVMAAAEGYGFAVARLDKTQAADNLTLRLVKDDVPIRGRILDLQGKPIAGVRVGIDTAWMGEAQLYVPKKGDLSDWLTALKTSKKERWEMEKLHLTQLYSPSFGMLIPPVTTGADGRFCLWGIGRERLARLRLEGPTIATQMVFAMTRQVEPIRLPLNKSNPKSERITYYGADWEVVAAPTKPVVGVVRDRVTGKPLAGVTIAPRKITNPWNISNYNAGFMQTTTDKEGRYRLIGLPKGEDNQLMATTKELPYLLMNRTVPNTTGLDPVTVDFPLTRGVWVKGRVTEKTTGKPLSGYVGYFCFNDNPHKKDLPLSFVGFHLGGGAGEDGFFRFVAVPGRGLLAVQAHYNGRFRLGVGVQKIEVRRDQMGGVKYLDTYPICQFENYNTLIEIAPKLGDESITCNLTVDPGRTLKGTVLGPDGKPLTGVRLWDQPLPDAGFTVWGLPPGKLRQPQVLEFVHEDKKLAGFLIVHGDEKGPLRVRLQPWGAITGRIVNPGGEPLTDVRVSCDVGEDNPDKQGRFRIEGLIPGRKYNLFVSRAGFALHVIGGDRRNLTVEPGETKDLGELKIKVMD